MMSDNFVLVAALRPVGPQDTLSKIQKPYYSLDKQNVAL